MNEEKELMDQEEQPINENIENEAQDSENNDKVKELEAQLQEANDRYLRQAAEFDNYRKRVAKENIERDKLAGESIFRNLLEVIDDSKRAEQQFKSNDDKGANHEGIILVFHKLQQILKNLGLEEIASIGTEFDPEIHEAVTEIPAPDPSMSGKIIDEITTGYRLNDKIIRHPKVIVGR